jgi:hypothetical protein
LLNLILLTGQAAIDIKELWDNLLGTENAPTKLLALWSYPSLSTPAANTISKCLKKERYWKGTERNKGADYSKK